MATYWEKLKDPRWQKKRLEILERDEFRCIGCGSEEKTLHVHHGYYDKNRDPWDYENETLYTYCEECHESMQGELADLHREIGFVGKFGKIRALVSSLAELRQAEGKERRHQVHASAYAVQEIGRAFFEYDVWKAVKSASISELHALDIDEHIALGIGASA